MTIVSSKLRLKLCFFLLPVCVEIQTYCGCGFAYVIERTPTRAPCLLSVWLLRVPTVNAHRDGLSLFTLSRDHCVWEKWTKQVHRTRAKWNPMANSVLCSKHFEEDCFEPRTDVRTGCEIRTASFASKHALQSLSKKPFLRIQCTKTHNLYHMWTFSISCYYYLACPFILWCI